MAPHRLADASAASRKTVVRHPRTVRRKIRQDVLRNIRAIPRKRRIVATIVTGSIQRSSLQDNPRAGAAMLTPYPRRDLRDKQTAFREISSEPTRGSYLTMS
jgi:hypothetical protein